MYPEIHPWDDLPIFCEGCPVSIPDGPYRAVPCGTHTPTPRYTPVDAYGDGNDA